MDWLRRLWLRIPGFWQETLEFFGNLMDDFRESSQHFKIKVGLIGGYLMVGVLTFLVFIPAGELNEIHARVRASKTHIVGGRYMLVVNEGSDAWKDVRLSLNGLFSMQWPALRPGKKKAFFFNRFRDQAGQRPAEGMQLNSFRIECDQGVFERRYDQRK